MIDINLLREYKGGNPEYIKESQLKRFADVSLVDKIIEEDNTWKKTEKEINYFKKMINVISKEISMRMKHKSEESINTNSMQDIEDPNIYSLNEENIKDLSIDKLKKLSSEITKNHIKVKEQESLIHKKARDTLLQQIGNIVHESVPINDNEKNNQIVRFFGNARPKIDKQGFKCLKHVDIMKKLGLLATNEGGLIAGNRGYFLMGDLMRLNLALQNYAIDFLTKRNYCPIYTPFFMTKNQMNKVAQLSQFDEELYTVSGEGEDKYLIATSEQPLAAYHSDKQFHEKELPIKYCGLSTCFRKEVGSHGKDTLGIFRVHQFEKIEQFVVTSPKDNKSWEMFDEMINNSEMFYQSLNIPYRIVNIVSGALNNAAAKKYDLEAWFPGADEGNEYRELVSCSNCTDYQARRLNVKYGKNDSKEYCHMLNSTLSATSRTICCIVENYQTKNGINVPIVLQPYMNGTDFIPYKQ